MNVQSGASKEGRLLLLFLLAVLAGQCALGASVIYDNGPVDGTIAGWNVSSDFQVADTFTLAASSTLTGVTFAAWLSSGDTAQTIDWAIVGDPTDQSGTLLFSGANVALSSTFLFSNGFGYDVYGESFDLGGLSLGSGAYWLVLMNGTTQQGDALFWDENDGPSQAWENQLGFLTVANDQCTSTTSTNCSETFQILGLASTSDVPEPNSLILIGMGLAGVFMVSLRISSVSNNDNNRVEAA